MVIGCFWRRLKMRSFLGSGNFGSWDLDWTPYYYVGDASREGLGGATQFPDGTIKGWRGVWDAGFAQGGSNLREAQNQVNHLLNKVRAGLHDGFCAV
jgi:hypothetical protein